jgi:hypothetical protein
VLGAGTRWMLWNNDVGLELVELLFFPDFIDGMRWILV